MTNKDSTSPEVVPTPEIQEKMAESVALEYTPPDKALALISKIGINEDDRIEQQTEFLGKHYKDAKGGLKKIKILELRQKEEVHNEIEHAVRQIEEISDTALQEETSDLVQERHKFNAETHRKEILSRLESFIDAHTGIFLAAIGDDDNLLRNIASRWKIMGSPDQRIMGTIFLSKLRKSPKDTSQRDARSKTEIEAKLKSFTQQTMAQLDTIFSPSDLFALESDDLIKAKERASSLYIAHKKTGHITPINDLYQHLQNRALGKLQNIITERTLSPLLKTPPIISKSQDRTPEISPEKEEHSPESWLDLQREDAYEQQVLFFEDLYTQFGDAGAQAVVMHMFNEALRAEGKPELIDNDIKSLRYATVSSESLSRIAGKSIRRPVLIFTDINELLRFHDRIFDDTDAAGFYIPGESFPEEHIMRKTGILFARNKEREILHELRHSIDPHVGTRKGIDGLVSEAFAYYHEYPRDQDIPWDTIKKLICGKNYYEDFYKYDDMNKPSLYEFESKAGELINGLKTLHTKMTSLDFQRLLISIKTFAEFVELIEQSKK